MIGAQHARAADGTDPRGWLVFDSLPNELQNAEDSTAAADRERRLCNTFGAPAVWGTDDPDEINRLRRLADDLMRATARLTLWATFARPATAAERTLLGHLGHDDLPDDLLTIVSYAASGVRER